MLTGDRGWITVDVDHVDAADDVDEPNVANGDDFANVPESLSSLTDMLMLTETATYLYKALCCKNT